MHSTKLHVAGRVGVARLCARRRLPSRSRCSACFSTTAPRSSAMASTRASAIGSCSRCRSAPSTPNAAGDPSLHVVNLPVSAVNWTATEKYAESARYSHYMANSAESDYAALAGDVAATLNAIVLAKDPKARLNMAVDARRRLASWPRDHYGYRADDVREMLGLLDEAISGLRVAAGETSFAHRPGRDDAAARSARSGADAESADARPRPSRRRLPWRRPPTSPSIVSRFFAASLPRSTIHETRCRRPGRGRPADGRSTRSREEARIEKTYAASDVDHAEARDRGRRPRRRARRASACSRPSSAETRSWAGSGPKRSTR